MSKRAEFAALKALPPRWRKTKDGKGKIDSVLPVRKAYIRVYEQAEKDIIALIESRISEILGDAQPKPALRAELQELVKRIKEEEQ